MIAVLSYLKICLSSVYFPRLLETMYILSLVHALHIKSLRGIYTDLPTVRNPAGQPQISVLKFHSFRTVATDIYKPRRSRTLLYFGRFYNMSRIKSPMMLQLHTNISILLFPLAVCSCILRQLETTKNVGNSNFW